MKLQRLQDYIHYCLGAKCTVVRNDNKEYEDIVCLGLLSDYQRSEHKRSDHISTIKPHLRRLEDMTEEEAEKLALIYSGADKVMPHKGIANNWHYFYCYFGEKTVGEILIIGSDGCAWYQHYFDKQQPGHRNIVNEHMAFHYLLKQGFDLFSLIDNNLAVDAKTINP